jgi:hypothetical protein
MMAEETSSIMRNVDFTKENSSYQSKKGSRATLKLTAANKGYGKQN